MCLGVFVEVLGVPGGAQGVPGGYLGALGAALGGTWGGLGDLWGRLGVARGVAGGSRGVAAVTGALSGSRPAEYAEAGGGVRGGNLPRRLAWSSHFILRIADATRDRRIQ